MADSDTSHKNSEMSGQIVGTKSDMSGQSCPTIGTNVPYSKSNNDMSGQSFPPQDTNVSQFSNTDSIIASFLQQQSLLVETLKRISPSGSTVAKTVTEPTPEPSDTVNDDPQGAPMDYGLEEVSSEEEDENSEDEGLLEDMSKLYDSSDGVSPKVNEKLASNINLSFRKKLSKDNTQKMTEKVRRPENCEI